MSEQNGGTPPSWEEGEEQAIRARNVRLLVRIGIVLGVVILVIALLYIAQRLYTDWLWFDSVEYKGVFKKILGLRLWLFFGGALLVAGLIAGNLYIAYRFARGESVLPVPPDVMRLARLGLFGGAGLTVVLMGLVLGIVAQDRWETFLLFFNRVSFGVEDPQFHKDMSFHVVVMPMLHFVQGWFMGVVIAMVVAAAALYLAIFALRGVRFTLTPRIRGHLAILGAIFMITIAAAHYLDIFELAFSGRGAAPGAGYTDVNARIPVLWLLVAIAMVSAVGFIVSLYYGGLRMMIAAFSLWAVLAVVAGAIYPAVFQRFQVSPNEFAREEEFIERAIVATRQAYNLDVIEEQRFDYTPTLTQESLLDNQETINNIRLWDHRPLLQTYTEKQAIRQYYNFVGVDVDRYRLANGEIRQVMLAARELFPENLEADAQNWVNRKLAYTHGFGVVMSPVNEATEEGLPEFFLKDVPPAGDLRVDQPEIYYGENTMGFVVVNTETSEFNYPGPGDVPVYQDYEGTGGIGIGSIVRRAAFAWRFLDFNLLISGELNSDSRVQFRRQIHDRVGALAPFLRLDSDPYLVVGEGGKLWWIQDAYTVTDRYAYSARFLDDFNYIRNSVKVVVDAYNGSVHFFVIDPEDPIILMYRKAFPEMFQDFAAIDDLDPTLSDHIRYPIDLFSAQAEIYLRYHMRDPQVFFAREDLWARAQEVFATPTNTQAVEPYYVIMKLPGEDHEEFVLLLPFTPGGGQRKNLVGWMAARNDGDNYGKFVTLLFPKDTQVDGPELIEARITSDENIGREFSLLCPEGKLCIRGNLLAIPMANSLLYVEPLYIRAEAVALPQLKKVIVADASNVVMADTLAESLSQLLGGVSVVVGGGQDPGGGNGEPSATGPDLGAIIGEVVSIEAAVEDLRQGLIDLEEALRRINETLGGGPS